MTEPLPALFKLSRAVAVLVTPANGVLSVTLSLAGSRLPALTPELASVALQLIVTLALFQPAAFGAGETSVLSVLLGNRIGPALSTTYVKVSVPTVSPWSATHLVPLLFVTCFLKALADSVNSVLPVPTINIEESAEVKVQLVFGLSLFCSVVVPSVTRTHSVVASVVTVNVSLAPLLP